jgi:hypothetical protein
MKAEDMENEARNYLVMLLDEAFLRTFTHPVRAVTGFDAGVHALSFDVDGHARDGGGYKVMSVLSSKDLRKFAEELDAFQGPVSPRYDQSDIELEGDIIISD